MQEPIAVVGSSCRFPGGASSPSKLWELLKSPRDVLREFPRDRLNLDAFYNKNGEHHGSTNVTNKGYLLEEDPRVFDASFFNINPMEADSMDPQQRLALESVYECIESAGYTIDQVQDTVTSVYLGVMTGDYHDIQQRDVEGVNRYHATGTAKSILSNRISYFFNLHGPSLTLDTACSSSLAALHLAVQSLRAGESSNSIVTGVNLILDSAGYVAESKLHMLSPTSRSRMWDASADGYARGEGVSSVLVKTLSQAVKDGDHIECLIRETGMNSDGRTTGITMPSASAQSMLIRQTYQRAGLDPLVDRPQYFECHGTGTLAGDPVEARAVRESFFPNTNTPGNGDEKLYCGSIKTIVGHLEGCAGLAGLLKASHAVQKGVIPPNLLFDKLNPAIEPFYDCLEVPTIPVAWPDTTSGPRRASLNSFGFGGTNVHAIVEQYTPDTPTQALQTPAPKSDDAFFGPLVLSAERESSLVSSVRDFADFIRSNPDVDLDDLAFVTQTRRTAFPQRAFFSAESRDKLLEFLDTARQTAESGAEVGIRAPGASPTEAPGILGIFTGQGAQWARMGHYMFKSCMEFRKSIERCQEALKDIPDGPEWLLADELLAPEDRSRISEAEISQPLCTAIQIATIDTLAAAGIHFNAVVGHSSGEIAAAHAAGILSASDAVRVVYYRGLHAKLATGDRGQRGAMMAIGMGYEDALVFCEQFRGQIGLAASNSPTSTTISGDEDAIAQAKEILDERKTFARLLKVDTAYHSHHMLPCAEPYLASLKACNITVNRPSPDCVWISSVYGHAELIDDEEDLQALNGQYWVDNMTKPVLFSEAVECSLWRAGPFDLALEIGPHPALKGPATQTIKSALGSILPYATFLRRGYHDVEAFSGGVGYIWAYLASAVDFAGYRQAFVGHDSPSPRMIKGIPSYSWNHDKIHWKESRHSHRYRLADRRSHELLGRRDGSDSDLELRWRNFLKVDELPWTRGHVFQGQILFPTSAYMAMAIQAAMEMADGRPVRLIEIRDLEIPRALTLEESHPGVESVFSIRRTSSTGDNTIEAEFACYTNAAGDGSGALERKSSGAITIELGTVGEDEDVLPGRAPVRSGIAPVDTEAYYDSLLNIGLDYQGLFRGIRSVDRCMGYATTKATWSPDDVGDDYIMHPGPLDVAFHSILAAFCTPLSGALRAPYLPVKVDRLTVTPNLNYIAESGQMEFNVDSFITGTTSNTFVGDIHIVGPDGRTGLQADGLTLKLFTESRESDDRPMFSRTVWKTDLLGSADNLDEIVPDKPELLLAEAIDRTSLYFIKKIFEPLGDSDVTDWIWFHKAFYNAAKDCLKSVADGKHPTAKKEWLQDSEELIMSYKHQYPEQADIKLIHAVAENLVGVMTSDVQLLEVMLQDDMLTNLYTDGRAMKPLNQIIADLVQNISHKYPRADILEVGAGTGGTTASILDCIGDAFGQYTYTDISAGFFENAKKRFEAYGNRLTYKMLDIERSPEEQGFTEGGHDVVLASNVLHATGNLKQTMENVRKLLKPGGYLIMMEVTGEFLQMMFLMGGLPGWWLGVNEGRTRGPGIGLKDWDKILRETGFTGADKYVTDLPDMVKHACSVIVTQASDERFAMLHEPMSFLDELPVQDRVLIIGGNSLRLSRTIKSIQRQVSKFAGQVQVVESVDAIDTARHTDSEISVISLADLEDPFFSETLTDERLRKLQALFRASTNVLWVTSGRLDDQPYANMSVGLGRALIAELPQLNLQFLDVSKGSSGFDASFVVETFVRLSLRNTAEFEASPLLWAVEPEMVLDDRNISVPRVVQDTERNDRLNSLSRVITREAHLADSQVTATAYDDHITLEQETPWLGAMVSEEDSNKRISLRTTHSVTLPLSKSDTLVSGTLVSSCEPALALVQSHSSQAVVHPDDVVKVEAGLSPGELQNLAMALVARSILDSACSRVTADQPIVIYDAPLELAVTINRMAKGRNLLFATAKPHSMEGIKHIYIHPRSSARSTRHQLPPNVGSIISLCRSPDLITTHLLSLYSGIMLPTEGLASTSELRKVLGETKSASPVSDDPLLIAAQDLPSASHHALAYPTVVDWSQEERPLNVTVRAIHGKGLFSADKTYLMVGLVSDLGRSICRWMIENGAKYLVLTSRSAKVDSLWLDEMDKLGAVVRVYKMDVSDKASVQSVCKTVRETSPPIAGVANGALVLKDQLFMEMDKDTLTDVFRPKVEGTMHLDEEFSKPDLDFFILFSSMSSVVGNAGQSNYNAASLFQAAVANHRRSRGLAASVMSLGMVADVGYIAQRGPSLMERLRKVFYMPISEADVHMIFAEAVATSRPRAGENWQDAAIETVSGIQPFTYNPNAPTGSRPPWFSNPRFSHYVRADQGSNNAAASDVSNVSVQAQLDAVGSAEEAEVTLLAAFSSKVESMLQMSPGTLNAEAPLLDAGIDSLLAVEIRTWFLKEVHVDVPVLKTLGGDNAKDISAMAANKYLAAKAESAGGQSAEVDKPAETPAEAMTTKDGLLTVPDTNPGSSANSTVGAASATSIGGSLTPRTDGAATPDTKTADSQSSSGDEPQDPAVSRIEELSHAQARLWLLHHMSCDPTQHNSLYTYDVQGSINATRLKRAVSAVVARHPSLRTCYFVREGSGRPVQGTLETSPECFTHIHSTAPETVESEIQRLSKHHWDLRLGHVFQVVLVSRTPSQHCLLIGYHHIVMDGVGFHVFLRDLNLAYQGKTIQTIGMQSIDIAADEKGSDHGRLAEGIHFWTRHHSPPVDTLPLLPFSRVNSRPTPDLYDNVEAFKDLGVDLAGSIKHASQKLRVTPFHFYLAAMQALFGELTDADELCIGITDANRNDSNQETVGFFLNLLPLRLRTGTQQETFAELVHKTSQSYYSAKEHSSVPFDVVLDNVGVQRDATTTPLFQMALNYRQGNFSELPLGNCQMSFKSGTDAKSPYDFAFSITPTSGTCYVQVVTRSDLYSQRATDMVLGMYANLLEEATRDVGKRIAEYHIYDDAGVERAANFGANHQKDFQWPATLTERVEKMTRDNPERTALKDRSGQLSYSELSQKAQTLAAHLQAHKAVRGSRIAVLCKPTSDWVISMLAILRIGATHVPLDTALPEARLASMLNSSGAEILLCQDSTSSLAHEISRESENVAVIELSGVGCVHNGNVLDDEDPRSAAFILFTSGSTGVPKGVALTSAGIINYLANKTEHLSLGPDTVVLQQSSLGFDMAIAQAFNALTNAGTLIIAAEEYRREPRALTELMVQEGVTFTIGCPTEYMMWLTAGSDALAQMDSWRFACSGGEAVTKRLCRALGSLSRAPDLINCYGPTEISCCATMRRMSLAQHDENDMSIGTPSHNVGIFVLDKHNRICPVGVPGQICVAGSGVAIGYLDADATAQSFLEIPVLGQDNGLTRIYKTGDCGVWQDDGHLGFLGRVGDSTTVKIRGLRLDLQDVASTILHESSGSITEAVVTVRGTEGDAFLVAHVVLSGKGPTTADTLDEYIGGLPLPPYMRPSRTIVLSQVPISPNGKVDRKRLEHMDLPEPRGTNTQRRMTPVTLTQGELRLLWNIVLDSELPLDSGSDFFLLGGTSLSFVKLQAAIRDDMGVDLSIRDMYSHSTLGDMTRLVTNAAPTGGSVPSINWEDETAIPDHLDLTNKTNDGPGDDNMKVLLTGSTGFLGSHILRSLLENDNIQQVHCVAVDSNLPSFARDDSRVIVHEGSLKEPDLGLDTETVSRLESGIDRIILAGAHGHCLNDYRSLRRPNVQSTKFLASLALSRHIPIHLVTSNRVTLLDPESEASLPPISVAAHPPAEDGSEGFTAAKWASEVFLERLHEVSMLSDPDSSVPIVIHRPCAMVGDKAPSEDALNALLRFSNLMGAVPRLSKLNVSGYFDFDKVESVAGKIARQAVEPTSSQREPGVRFQHHSGGPRVRPTEFRSYMESFYGREFLEVDLDEWIFRALDLGIEELIVVYLRAVTESGRQMVFPYMGASCGS